MVKVVGLEKVDYVSNKTGKPVIGFRVHCLRNDRQNVEGNSVESFFVSKRNVNYEKIGTIVFVGREYNVYYNRFGDIEDIRPVEQAPAPAGKAEAASSGK